MPRLLLSLPLILLLLGSCGPGKDTKRFKKKGPPPEVTVLTVKGKEEAYSVNVQGETEPSDSFHLKASGPIQIEKVFVEEGQKVAVGDSLVSFDQRETRLKLEVARAEVKEMELALETNGGGEEKREGAREGEEEVEEMTPRIIGEGANVEDKEKRHALNEARLERARAEVNLYENALLNDQIGSPIAGVVAKRKVSDGMQIDTNDPIIEIVRIDPIYFVFSLPVTDVPFVRREGSVVVRFPVLKGREVRGEVLSVGASVSREEGKVEIKLKLPNDEGVIHAGMEGEISLSTGEKRRLFVVPESALQRDASKNYLYVVNEERVKRVPVESSGPAGKGEVRVRSGLKEGDQVVTKSSRSLKDHDSIEVVDRL